MQKVCSPRSSAKRTAILDAAQACFLELGYANTSMDMVAARAGVSKATIYAHFQSKDDLFGAIIRRRCTNQMTFDDVSLQGMDARAALTALANQLMRLFVDVETMGIYRMVVAEAARHPDLAKAYYEAGPLLGKARLAEVFAAMNRLGLMKVPDPRQATDAFIGMLRTEFFHRKLLGLPDSDQVTADSTVANAVETMVRAYGR